MNDWKEVSLSDLATYINGRVIKNEELNSTKGIPIIRIKQMNDPEMIEDFFCGKDLDEKNIARKGDLLFSWSATLKTILWQGPKGAINQHIFKVIPKEGIDKSMLHYLIDHYIPFLTEESHGSTMKHIKKSALSAFRLKIPPLPEQKSIAKILTFLDKLISKLEKQKSTQKNIFTALISDFFLSKDSTISNVKIGEICKVKRGASPRPIQSTLWWGKGRGWTRITDVTKSHKYLLKTKDHLSPEGELKSVPIDPDDLILSICATIGLPIIVKTPICIHDGFVWFEGLKNSLEIEYAYYFFSAIRNQLLQGSQTGTQGNLNTSIVSNIEIPLRSFEEQERISSILSSLDNKISITSNKIDKYKNLKRSLLNNLLSGRKRVKF